jgi:hypothetical protein
MRRNHITANKEKMIVYRPSHLSGMKGGALWDNIVSGVRSALAWAKKNKVISKGLTAAAPLTGTYAPIALGASALADKLGYGKRRGRPKGKGLVLSGGMYQQTGRGRKKVGGMLNPAGMGKKKKVRQTAGGIRLAGAGSKMKGCGKVKKQTVFP